MKYTPPLGSLEADAPYVDGNPTAGIRGSVVPAAPFNQLQKELVHIITQAGLEPSADDLTQVLAALKKLFAAPSAIIPPDGVTIIEKEIGSGKKVLAAASAGTLDTLEAWRKSMIGAPMMLPSPSFPTGTCGRTVLLHPLKTGRSLKKHTKPENLKDMCCLRARRTRTRRITPESGCLQLTPRDYTRLA